MLHVFVIAFLLQAVISQAPPPPNVTCSSDTFLRNPQMNVCEFCTCKNNSVDHCYSSMDITGEIEVALMTLCPSLNTCTTHVYVFDSTANTTCSCPSCGQSSNSTSTTTTNSPNNSTSSGCSYNTQFTNTCSFCMCSSLNGVVKELCVNSSSILTTDEVNKLQSYCHLSGSCTSDKWTWGSYNGISLDSCCPSCGNMTDPPHNMTFPNGTHSPFSTQMDCTYTIEMVTMNDVSKCAVCDCNYNGTNVDSDCRSVSSNMSSNTNSIDWIRKACSSLQMCETQYWVLSDSCTCPTCNKPSTTHALNNGSSTTQSNKCANSVSIGCNVFTCESNDQADPSIKFEVWGTTRWVWDSRSQVWSALKWAFNELSMTYASLNVSIDNIKVEDWALSCNFNGINVGNESQLNDTNNSSNTGRRLLQQQDGGSSTTKCSFYVKVATYLSSSVTLETLLESFTQNSATISPDYARNCNQTSKEYDTYGFNGVDVSQYTITEYDSSGNVVSSTTGTGNKSEGVTNVYNMVIMLVVMIVSLIMFTH